MTKIHYCSDLHINFKAMDVNSMPDADILIIAGDIAELPRILEDKKRIDKSFFGFYDQDFTRCFQFFLDVSEKYEDVFLVMGNHEHYGTNLNNTKETLERILPSNVRVLENDFVDFPDFRIVGSTLWTSMDGENPLSMVHAQTRMADYKHIEYHGKTLTPTHTVKMHHEAITAIAEAVDGTDKPVIVVTHHAPSFKSTPANFVGDPLNPAYCSDLSNFICLRGNLAWWIHGHIHNPVDYMIGDCNVVSNPRGYNGLEVEKYSKEKMIEI